MHKQCTLYLHKGLSEPTPLILSCAIIITATIIAFFITFIIGYNKRQFQVKFEKHTMQ